MYFISKRRALSPEPGKRCERMRRAPHEHEGHEHEG